MGEEVAAVLRTAHEQVAALKAKGEADIAEQKQAAESQADAVKVEAEQYAADAAHQHRGVGREPAQRGRERS